MPETDNTRLSVKVIPGASHSEVAGYNSEVLSIRIAAAPEKGKANRALVDFLSKQLGIRKSDISIIKGETSRNKILEIRSLAGAEILKRLNL